jgi:hypothetical protein
MSAIEKGILTNSTKSRLDELETLQAEISAKIAIEKTKLTIMLKKEEIVGYIRTALKKDPQQMVDLLVKQIILFDDKIMIRYNYIRDKDDDDLNIEFFNGSTYLQPCAP